MSINTPAVVETYREALDRAISEKEKERNELVSELRSDENSPEQRIKLWEKLHHLRMPVDPTHSVLDVIAVATRLTLSQVHQAQINRSRGSASVDS